MLVVQECMWCGAQTIAPCTQYQVTEEGCWMRDDPNEINDLQQVADSIKVSSVAP